jgi:SAM-dependent methyltransferase
MPSFDRPERPESDVSGWVRRFAHLVRKWGAVLDIAAGHGRHARFFLGRDHPVTAVDIDVSELRDIERHPRGTVLELDLEQENWPLEHQQFDGIVVTNYLHRPHFPHLVDCLRPGGVLIFESFAVGNERYGRPRNPDFLLRPGELLAAFASSLQVVAYECGLEQRPRPAVRQRICAVRSAEPRELASAS